MHVPLTTDEALVEEAREGDRLAFEALLQPLISPAYRLALVMVRATPARPKTACKRPRCGRGGRGPSCVAAPSGSGPGSSPSSPTSAGAGCVAAGFVFC